MLNGNGVKIWLEILKDHGPLVLILFIFLGIFVGVIPSPLATKQGQDMIMAELREQDKNFDRWASESLQVRVSLERVLRQVCLNTAQTQMQRDKCDVPK